MIEVEVKVKISNPEKYKKIASGIGKFKGRKKKIDYYYSLENPENYPKKSLRIRKIDHLYEINFKRKLSYAKGIYAKNEEEFYVSNLKNFLDLIKDFGFKKWLRKEKTTYLYEIDKSIHIEINYVRKLGWFIEVEYLTTPDKIPRARKEIRKVLKQLNLDKSKIIKEGYTKMLWNKTI